jgi:hypothetical protein
MVWAECLPFMMSPAPFVLDYSHGCRRAGCGLDARANRRGYPPRKPLPAKRIPADIRSLCRSYTGEAVRSLAAIMRNGDKDATRVAAAAILLDRGWGRAPQSHADEDDKDIHVTIRQIVARRDED